MAYKISSGTTAKSTDGDTAITILAANADRRVHSVRITKDAGVAAFVSVDSGGTWDYFPAAAVSYSYDDIVLVNDAVMLKRVPSGSNVTGIYCSAWEHRY